MVPEHRLVGRGGAQQGGPAAVVVLPSHGPAETASVATAHDEFHMLGSRYYKISDVTTAYE